MKFDKEAIYLILIALLILGVGVYYGYTKNEKTKPKQELVK